MNCMPSHSLRATAVAARAALLAASTGLMLPTAALAQQQAGAPAEQTVTVSGSRLPSTLRAMQQSVQLIDATQDNARVGNWTSSFVPRRTNDGWRFVSTTGVFGSNVEY